jgi:hypothetical protein
MSSRRLRLDLDLDAIAPAASLALADRGDDGREFQMVEQIGVETLDRLPKLSEGLERAVGRGEIPAARDLELIPDALLGLNPPRILLGGPPDREYVRCVASTLLSPLATADHAGESQAL